LLSISRSTSPDGADPDLHALDSGARGEWEPPYGDNGDPPLRMAATISPEWDS
jgi:hypothetical protein